MPLKESILPLLERSDPLSTKIGSVNTVLRAQDGKFYGFNTDVAGIVSPLERRLPLRGAKILVLGAGGAASAAVFGCRDKGAEVFLLNRTPATATALAKAAGAKVIQREAVAKAAFDVVINATPAGMNGVKAELLLQPDDLNARIVFDLVYNPLETPLLRLAKQKGLTAISGLEMFVSQGARQFEIWTGKPAPQEEMLRVVLHALRQNAAYTPQQGVMAEAESQGEAPPSTSTRSTATKTNLSDAHEATVPPASDEKPARAVERSPNKNVPARPQTTSADKVEAKEPPPKANAVSRSTKKTSKASSTKRPSSSRTR